MNTKPCAGVGTNPYVALGVFALAGATGALPEALGGAAAGRDGVAGGVLALKKLFMLPLGGADVGFGAGAADGVGDVESGARGARVGDESMPTSQVSGMLPVWTSLVGR